MHIGMSDLWFSKRNWLEDEKEWQQGKCEYSEEVGEIIVQVGKLNGYKNIVWEREREACSQFVHYVWASGEI